MDCIDEWKWQRIIKATYWFGGGEEGQRLWGDERRSTSIHKASLDLDINVILNYVIRVVSLVVSILKKKHQIYVYIIDMICQ